jgi:hypothetical protein
MLSVLGSLLLVALITVVPVMLAARFVGAERAHLVFCALAVVVATLVAVIGYKVVGGSLPGLGIAFLGMIITYSVILKASLGSAFGLTIIAFAIQVGIVFALTSFGFSIVQKITF